MKIKEAIDNNKRISIIAHTVSEDIEYKLHNILDLILNKYNHPKLLTPLYTCVKELLMNAVKANYKNIYFENYAPKNDAQDIVNYETSLKLFKLEMSRGDANYLKKLAKKWKLSVKISVLIKDHVLFVTITNPVAMTELEIRKVNEKLSEAQTCDDMGEYFTKVDDDPEKEGAGLGLVLISMVLKSLDLPQSSLTIKSTSDATTSSLVIPLNRSFDFIE